MILSATDDMEKLLDAYASYSGYVGRVLHSNYKITIAGPDFIRVDSQVYEVNYDVYWRFM